MQAQIELTIDVDKASPEESALLGCLQTGERIATILGNPYYLASAEIHQIRYEWEDDRCGMKLFADKPRIFAELKFLRIYK